MEVYNKIQAPVFWTEDYYVRTYSRLDQGGNPDSDVTLRTGPYSSYGIDHSLSGYKQPMYRSLIRQGLNATTPLSASDAQADVSYVTAGTQFSDIIFQGHKTAGAEIYGYIDHPDSWQYPSTPPDDVIADVTNRCIRKFLDRAEAIRSSVEAGQDFGEYRETLNGITSPLSALRRHVFSYFPSVEKLKGKYRKDRVSLLKALSDTYLEWTFGWKPLTLDIANAFVGLQNRSRFSDRQMVSASAAGRYQATIHPTYRVTGSGLLYGLKQSSFSYSEYKVKMYGMIRTGAVNGLVSRAQTLELDLPHFVPTIWDLIPYSFIVDYFTNVGDIIRSMSTIGSFYVWSGESQSNTRTHQFSDVFWDEVTFPPDQAKLDFSFAYGGRSKFTIKLVNRYITSPASFLPVAVIHLPTSEKPWENLAALLLSRIAHLVPLI